MKTIGTIFFTLFICVFINAQTIKSITSGNWYMPTTWDCNCVPIQGNNIEIKYGHTVTLASDWLNISSTITIHDGGTLTQDTIKRTFVLNGGTLINYGTIIFSKLTFLSGTLSNQGYMHGIDSVFFFNNFFNSGTIETINFYNSDSLSNDDEINATNLYNSDTLTNKGHINVTNYFNNGYFINGPNGTYGHIYADNFYNNSITENSGFLVYCNCTNTGVISNNNNDFYGYRDLANSGTIYNNFGCLISVQNNCTNGDTLNHNAHLFNNGHTFIGNDFTNLDSLFGNAPGYFCVNNNSSNYGAVLGNFDFCDYLTSGFGINSGTISNGITYCQNSCFFGINENILSNISIYPNPVKENLTIRFNSSTTSNSLQIVNSCGQIVYEQAINGIKEITVSRNSLPAGLYLLKVSNDNSSITKKLIFE